MPTVNTLNDALVAQFAVVRSAGGERCDDGSGGRGSNPSQRASRIRPSRPLQQAGFAFPDLRPSGCPPGAYPNRDRSVGGRRAVAHRRGGHGWPSPGCRRVASGRGSRQRSSAGSALSSGSCRLSRCWRQTETTWSIDLSPPGSTTRWSLPPRTAPRGCNAKHRDRLLTRNASCGTWYAGQPAFTRRSDRWHSTMRHAQAKPAAQRRRMVR